MLSLLPEKWQLFFAGPDGVPIKTALWQAPLVAVLANEIGIFLAGFWLASLGVSVITQKWQHWAIQLVLLSGLIGASVAVVPVRSADFFILILIALLPMTWRLDSQNDHRPLSPAGLTPTIFLVGAVFIYQIQFVVLLLLVIWLISFLLWYCMALTGFRLDSITLRWLPVLGLSTIVAGIIVALFTVVPRIDTGFIPGFADPKQKIALGDEVSPGGMSDLLADTDIAFKAVPERAGDNTPRYWRVFVLDEEVDGVWRRSLRRNQRISNKVAAANVTHSYSLLADKHDMTVLPVPDWPAGWSRNISYTRWGEATADRLGNARRVQITGSSNSPDLVDAGEDMRRHSLLSGANPQLVAWARQERQKTSNDAAFAEMMMTRFRDGFTYSTQVSLPETNALDAFFFEGKEGYCSYFATALATALRAGGIEANVVVGYLGGEWNVYGDFWSVRNADAHAWVEARLDGGDWQRIDPTLAVTSLANVSQVTLGGEPQLRSLGSMADRDSGSLWQSARLLGNWVEALNTRLTLAIMDYGTNDGAADGDSADYTAMVILVLSLGLTGVFVFAGVMAWNRRKTRVARIEARFVTVLMPLLGTADRKQGERKQGETILGVALRASEQLRQIGNAKDLNSDKNPPYITPYIPPYISVAHSIELLGDAITQWRFSPHTGLQIADIQTQLKMLAKELRAVELG